MIKALKAFSVAMSAVFMAACGSSSQSPHGSNSISPGTLAVNPPFRIASLDSVALGADLAATAAGAQLLLLTGVPTCGVDFYQIKFWTVGAGANEATESSGALMIPTGGGACSGPRPIVLYAHGTQTDRAFNIADITNPSNAEGALVAATFAAQGYIVVAPNYAGYDTSTLGYHPFLNAKQQSGEMMDVLKAARTALPSTFSSATTDSGQLFVAGYSEGGHVAMATLRALQAAGVAVTAAAPMSGPYALEAFGDAIFFGAVNLGSTVFSPLLATSYQHEYGNIYQSTADIYSPTYASGIDGLLPSPTPIATLFATSLLPQTALFDSMTPTVPGQAALTAALAVPSDPTNPLTPLFAAGFGTPFLINNDYRVSYAVDAASNPDGVTLHSAGAPLAAAPPAQHLRFALYDNDMRSGGWAPNSPTLLCGGDLDPTVFFSVNTETMASFWSALPAGLVTVLDVNAPPSGPFAAVQAGFSASQTAQFTFYTSAAGGNLSAAAAQLQLVQGYHTAVAPFCMAATRAFFSQFLGVHP